MSVRKTGEIIRECGVRAEILDVGHMQKLLRECAERLRNEENTISAMQEVLGEWHDMNHDQQRKLTKIFDIECMGCGYPDWPGSDPEDCCECERRFLNRSLEDRWCGRAVE